MCLIFDKLSHFHRQFTVGFKLRVGVATFDQKMSFLRARGTTEIPKNEVDRSKIHLDIFRITED